MTFCQAESQTPFDHEPPRLPPPNRETARTPDPDPIRIYVACLAAYNNGHLHGAWIEITDEAAIWQAVQDMLAKSPIEEDAEEWAIHDYEGFEGAEVGQYFSFANVVELADYIRERGALGAQVLNYYGGNIEDAQARFEEYAGEYDSLADYSEELTEQSGLEIPQSIAPYIDYTRMAHDYEQSGDFLTFRVGGSVHIFWAH
ncbi:antirestriction protein ArdA [Litorimonas haliclonae]|jgi:antirestriction protein|uniref:antirestriction protein ArdA n=1 Tax=Litorimonas haliclonae TaxID=2081977 RepID=UPI0039EE4B3A